MLQSSSSLLFCTSAAGAAAVPCSPPSPLFLPSLSPGQEGERDCVGAVGLAGGAHRRVDVRPARGARCVHPERAGGVGARAVSRAAGLPTTVPLCCLYLTCNKVRPFLLVLHLPLSPPPRRCLLRWHLCSPWHAGNAHLHAARDRRTGDPEYEKRQAERRRMREGGEGGEGAGEERGGGRGEKAAYLSGAAGWGLQWGASCCPLHLLSQSGAGSAAACHPPALFRLPPAALRRVSQRAVTDAASQRSRLALLAAARRPEGRPARGRGAAGRRAQQAGQRGAQQAGQRGAQQAGRRGAQQAGW